MLAPMPIAGPHAVPFKIDGSHRCLKCGAKLVQKGRGRPRKWCSDPCARRAYRAEGRTK